jgi:hypothetical protein
MEFVVGRATDDDFPDNVSLVSGPWSSFCADLCWFILCLLGYTFPIGQSPAATQGLCCPWDRRRRPVGSSEMWRIKVGICCANGRVLLYGTTLSPLGPKCGRNGPVLCQVFGTARSPNKTRTSTKATTINYNWICISAGSNDDAAHLFCTAIASFAKSWGGDFMVDTRTAHHDNTPKYHDRQHQKCKFQTNQSQPTIHQRSNVTQSRQKTGLEIVGGKNLLFVLASPQNHPGVIISTTVQPFSRSNTLFKPPCSAL